ncbi:hypothetical protein LL14B4_12625 [Lactococcus lactis subsp. lactis]|uniref:Uncharacterized protein n=1 Tax=Lactococcus lactis subsp. lactis TaxID=1360 RepID=A0A2Z3KJR2_LACLL|nr:hypothetical protein [Lactococcus lactis]AWN66951.1 hypothetical protein LL14B4_12625 [Lactococcus lactis subsp. lactis]
MQEVQAKIQLNGFTVRITEGVTIFFESSQENVTRLMSINESDSGLNTLKKRAEQTLKPIDAKIQKAAKENSLQPEMIKESVAAQVNIARELYEYIYGAGIFEDLYSKIHDVTFWLENAEEIFQATLRGLDADAKVRQRRMLNAQKKYINKKNKKRKR